MASQSGNLIQNLISGGMAAPLAKLVANAIANANAGQLSKGADSVDATPALAMRMIDADARRYQFPNLDYSPDQPYQDTLGASPVQYADATAPHPYQDSQPVQASPPLSQPAIKGGAYIDAMPGVENNASQTVVNLRIKQGDGTHLRLNPATNSIESVPLSFNFPQGIVAGSVSETEAGTEITLSVPNQTLLAILSAYNRPVYQCRAWALFSAKRNTAGTDDLSTLPLTNRLIRNSGNVASVQRIASGLYQVFFTTPMLTTTYSVMVTMSIETVVLAGRVDTTNHTTTSCRVFISNAAQTLVENNTDYVHVAVFE
jgi:hypothetical protein